MTYLHTLLQMLVYQYFRNLMGVTEGRYVLAVVGRGYDSRVVWARVVP
jgi:hypothetical protein